MALNAVSVSFDAGTVHALVGENGAGKSTLIKVVTGAIAPTEGQVVVDGGPYPALTPRQAIELGISVVYQEFNLIPTLNVAENIFFGRERVQSGVFRRQAEMVRESQDLIDRLGVPIDARRTVRDLSVGFQQIVEIAKGLSLDARVFILDEPTAPLTTSEVDHLYSVVRRLREAGVAIVFITHRLQEVFDLCDVVTVLRDGQLVETRPVEGLNRNELIRMMVGREVTEVFPPHEEGRRVGDVVLQIKGLSTKDLLRDINVEVRAGEIVGLAGLVGAGRTETAKAIFGAERASSGDVLLDGKRLHVRTPSDAIRQGIGLIPEDRKREGGILQRGVGENVTYANLPRLSPGGFIRWGAVRAQQQEYREKLGIRTPSLDQLMKNLSGGNQQKVVLAKWLATACKVLVFDEPTRGVDVGAKQEIYHLMRSLAAEGRAIIMISSDMPELLGMSDRIYVFREGRVVGELGDANVSQEVVLQLAAR